MSISRSKDGFRSETGPIQILDQSKIQDLNGNPIAIAATGINAEIQAELDLKLEAADMQSAATWAAVASQTTDPLVVNQPWSNFGVFTFSMGPGAFDFSINSNSQYIPIFSEDF